MEYYPAYDIQKVKRLTFRQFKAMLKETVRRESFKEIILATTMRVSANSKQREFRKFLEPHYKILEELEHNPNEVKMVTKDNVADFEIEYIEG